MSDHANNMVAIPAGSLLMGSNHHYPEEAPVREVRIEAFQIDTHPVTNELFAQFVSETGYKTVAENPLDPAKYPGVEPKALKPGALVFCQPNRTVDRNDWSQWWTYVRGAYWRRPDGKTNVFAGRRDHPVVHVAYADAMAYADWAGKDLPTEAEWEFAARGGLVGAEFVWGDAFTPDGKYMANTWQGVFPVEDLALDGFRGTSPAGSFPPNGYGLYDMAGNVWEWTRDWFLARGGGTSEKSCCTASLTQEPPTGSFDSMLPAIRIPRRVVKATGELER